MPRFRPLAAVLIAAAALAIPTISVRAATPATVMQPATAPIAMPDPVPSLAGVNASSVAQALPVPIATTSARPQTAPSAVPLRPFRYSGNLRAFYFVRQNAQQNAANPNRTAFLPGGTLHLEYHPVTPLSIGTTYTGAYAGDINGPSPEFNNKIDNTVPGFPLSTFDEAYVAYKTAFVDASVGDKFYNFIWMPISDARVKPSAYQGGDISFRPIPGIQVGVSRIIRFESRTSSNFQPDTLLTAFIPGQPTPLVVRNTAGALHTYLFGTTKRFTGRFENYQFYDMASLFYADAKYSLAPKSKIDPYLAVQEVNEQQTGRAIFGTINNNTIGFQLGVSASKQLAFTFGYDESPARYADVTAATAAIAQRGILMPTGGTSATAQLAPGRFRTAYGGLASPYTDGYAFDPLYTTSISQGIVDRRSPGQAFKVAALFVSPNGQFRGTVSEAYYQYDNFAGQNRTFEDDVDLQYFFNRVGKGLYKGLAYRQRYANREQPTIPFDFKYVRSQLTYDF